MHTIHHDNKKRKNGGSVACADGQLVSSVNHARNRQCLWTLSFKLLMISVWSQTFAALPGAAVLAQPQQKLVPEQQPDELIRNTLHGPVKGFRFVSEKGISADVFLAIPYAMPPVGSLRFKKPLKPKSWRQPIATNSSPPYCIQFWYDYPDSSAQHGRPQSEDCLYLNVFAPAARHSAEGKTQLYPVLVWVHGGSYQVGGANAFPLPETVEQFVGRGLVMVFVNYRLGALGFLSLMHRDCPGNFGLLDQILALEWVRDNIASFGGDPSQVTLAGESAGAASASLLAVSPKIKGLINRVMVRSGSGLSTWAVRSRSTDMNSVTLAQLIGCHPQTNVALVVECLQAVPASRFVEAWRHIAHDDLGMFFIKSHKPMNGNHPALAHTFFTPVVDSFMQQDSVLPTYPLNLVQENAHLPLLIGTTTAECTGYVAWLAHAESQNFLSKTTDLEYVVPSLLYRNAEQVKYATAQHYLETPQYSNNVRRDGLPQPFNRYQALVEIASDQHFVVPAANEASLYAEAGLPVYAYSFDHLHTQLNKRYFTPGIEIDFEIAGAGHGYDSVFIFRNSTVLDHDFIEMQFSAADDRISCFLIETLSNFVKTGNPNPPAGANRSQVKCFDEKVASSFWTMPSAQTVEGGSSQPSLATDWPTFQKSFGQTLFISEQGHRVVSSFTSKFYFWRDSVPTIEALTLSHDFLYAAAEGSDKAAPSVDSDCGDELIMAAKFKTAFYACVVVLAVLTATSAVVVLFFARRQQQSRFHAVPFATVKNGKPPAKRTCEYKSAFRKNPQQSYANHDLTAPDAISAANLRLLNTNEMIIMNELSEKNGRLSSDQNLLDADTCAQSEYARNGVTNAI